MLSISSYLIEIKLWAKVDCFDSNIGGFPILCTAAGSSFLEPPGGQFYSINRISWIRVKPELISRCF